MPVQDSRACQARDEGKFISRQEVVDRGYVSEWLWWVGISRSPPFPVNSRLTSPEQGATSPAQFVDRKAPEPIMKVASSLKTLKSRDRNCQVVRRRGRLYVINKRNPRMKARQG